ncbi:MAG TPA: phosphoribosyl-AMP cyclohydrolase [Spirochaetia bacterium]|nr:phosphoribosyl-AMP cyclohydrolase [Spirochaetia bacterium]
MKRDSRSAGQNEAGSSAPLAPNFSKMNGLIPAVVQEQQTREVLMVAFMNQEAWERTLATGYAHYFSRTRNAIWKKGETSGHLQEIREIMIDCDDDSVLLLVNQVEGSACHTGNRSCFYRTVYPYA